MGLLVFQEINTVPCPRTDVQLGASSGARVEKPVGKEGKIKSVERQNVQMMGLLKMRHENFSKTNEPNKRA